MKSRGFTLVEVIVASMLAGILLAASFPMVMSVKKNVIREQERESAAFYGDAVFEYIADELKTASRIYLGDLKSVNVSERGAWKALYSGESSEDGVKVLMQIGSAGNVKTRFGKPVFSEAFTKTANLELHVEAVDSDWLKLTVQMISGKEILYERDGILSLLNLASFEDREIEIDENCESVQVIWYRGE